MNAVATPKLPPPPRSAQKRSGSDSAVTSRSSPSAVTRSNGEQVVGGEAVLRHQPAEAAAERQPGDARRRDRAAGHREAVLGRRGVHVGPIAAALGSSGARVRIDIHRPHLREVDHHRVVHDRTARDVVTAAAYADVEPGLAGEANRLRDVVCIRAAHDHGRAAIDQAVVHLAGVVVPVVLRPEHSAGRRSSRGRTAPARRRSLPSEPPCSCRTYAAAESSAAQARLRSARASLRPCRAGRGRTRATMWRPRPRTRRRPKRHQAPSSRTRRPRTGCHRDGGRESFEGPPRSGRV